MEEEGHLFAEVGRNVFIKPTCWATRDALAMAMGLSLKGLQEPNTGNRTHSNHEFFQALGSYIADVLMEPSGRCV